MWIFAGAGELVIVLEAMKMEFIVASANGVVQRVHCTRGGMVMAGQNLSTLRVG
jgi:biotin carboxyl carrier protein